MAANHAKTFVGFGFGPIQSGLFLYEARAAGNFDRLVVAEVVGTIVRAVRGNEGRFVVNIARRDRIDAVAVEGIEIYNPQEPGDREALVAAVAESDEMATCLPSVDFYESSDATSVAQTIAQGLARRRSARPTVVYAAENHNRAAEMLRERIAARAPGAAFQAVQTLNTVIGKMSGVIDDASAIERIGLTTITPDLRRAVLIEEFNRILTSRIELAGFCRGIDVFVEKDDLLPFEEAKLYGHNAIHSLIAYLADLKGLATMADAGRDRGIMQTARQAFLAESGAALIRRHAGLGEALFTPEGYRQYADDLLARMVNPHLHDQVARVGRDHRRKLGYDDRLFGTMRLALRYGIRPARLALGAAAGVVSMIRRQQAPGAARDLTEGGLRKLLVELWGDETDEHRDELIALTGQALGRLRRNGYLL